jgi:hypothetical protein
MDDLIQLVAESFARHGIECSTVDPQSVKSVRAAETPISAILPEHNFRESKEVILTP